jgi:hypothetical protein
MPRLQKLSMSGAITIVGLLVVAGIAVPAPCWAFVPRAIIHPAGEGPGDDFGWRACGGDVNGDGYDDVIVGAADAGPDGEGQVYVYFGGPQIDDVADLVFTGEVSGDEFGYAVAIAGDVNGDGHLDVLVGAPFAGPGGTFVGRAYVYFGGPAADTTPDLTLFGEADHDIFGAAVAGAGDVNGDGYDDVIVGAYYSDGGGPIDDDRGRAYVFYGGPAPDSVPDLILTGEAADDEFGESVGSAGDVNADGYADVIVGALQSDAGGAPGDNVGRAYIFFGGPGADAVPDRTLTGEAIGDRFGISVSGGADFNGDGFDDVIVGAFLSDYGGQDAGRAYIYYGGPGMDLTADVLFAQGPADSHFGYSVAFAGDVNRDGYADAIVGIGTSDPTTLGRAYLYCGGGPLKDTYADAVFQAESPGDRFGTLVAGAGDVDADGYPDVIVGAWATNSNGSSAGRAYVYSIRPYQVLTPNGGEQWVAGTSRVIRWLGGELADLWISLDAGMNYSLLAQQVGGAERNEFSVIAPPFATGGARVRVSVTGETVTFDHADESDGVFRVVESATAPAAAHRLAMAPTGAAAGDAFGGALASAGDVNGDGYDDVIVGAWANDAGGANAGRAYVHYGGPVADGVADLTLTAEAAGDAFGASVSGAGDVNGDGYDDVIVGARLNDGGGADAGRAYVFYGGVSPDAIADLILTGEAAGDFFGVSVRGAGDVNGDGYADVIVGAYGNDAGGDYAGRAYVYFGGVVPNSTADLTLTGEAAGNYFGQSVSGAGDVNGDGYGDLIVGAQFHSAGGIGAGRAYVYFGGPDADATPELTLTGEGTNHHFGYSVSDAGDVNGDGYGDVIVGAYGYAAGTGGAYVYYGGPGTDDRADVFLLGETAGDNFGEAVSAAGDVNGDGFGDVLVGAWVNDAGGANAGRAYVFYGGAVADAASDIVFTGEAAADRLGLAISSGGDTNGDGFDDILVGADGNDAGGVSAGRAYLYACNRYFVTSPNGGETWNVGATRTISWLGSETADVWLSSDGGITYDLLKSHAGGAGSNSMPLQVPHTPTKFAKIRITPTNAMLSGSDQSDSLFTIQTSVELLALMAAPVPNRAGAAVITWATDPGPEDLAGYRLMRATDTAGAPDWRTAVSLTRKTSYTDEAVGAGGTRYRLYAVNGLGEELMLGETSLPSRRALAAWPLPYRGGDLTLSFATASAMGGGPAPVDVSLFDVSGRLVRKIAVGSYTAGYQTAVWDGRDSVGRKAAAGIYLLRVTSAGQVKTLKFAVLH